MGKWAFALLTVSIFATTAAAQSETPWADKLFGGVISHDFGVIARGSQAKYSFKMTNIYKVPLQIIDMRVSCGCLKAEPSTNLIQPGETAQINVIMDAATFSGPKTIRAYVTVGPKYVSTSVLTISGDARGDVAFTPNELDFGNLQSGAASKQFDVEYTGAQSDWQVTEIVKSSSAPFELKVEELPRLVNGPLRRGYRLTVTLRADAGAGAFKQEVVLKTNDSANPVLTYHVAGNIQSQEALAISPATIVVNGLRTGESQTKKIFVRAARPFRILGVEGQGDGVTVDVPNRQDATQVLTVSVQPMHAGVIRCNLIIRTDLDNQTTRLAVEANIEP